ncbi:hypothetical protein Cni_G24088 [Canna indica]|uniref:Uncharacterized protein n=1 Tax=Canna indica TaxID=4628 RepID=A0AAQ3KXC7_9LILI|nr:hypothetical protein Cni_G24088 [Canna indica]
MMTKKTRRGSSPPLPPSTPPEATGAITAQRKPSAASRPRARCGEVAGGTAADCTAVCCCCPCVLVNLLLLASVRLPARLCRRVRQAHVKRKEKARKRKEAKMLKKGGSQGERASSFVTAREEADEEEEELQSPATAAMAEVEKTMQSRFYNTGFWRSPSTQMHE